MSVDFPDSPLIIPGTPVAKARPRVTRTGTYTPKTTAAWEEKACFLARRWWGRRDTVPAGVPLSIRVDLLFARPKSLTEIRERLWCPRGGRYPDFDNCVKAVLDALQEKRGRATGRITKWGVFYDDAQVVELTARKMFCGLDEAPGVVIRIALAQ